MRAACSTLLARDCIDRPCSESTACYCMVFMMELHPQRDEADKELSGESLPPLHPVSSIDGNMLLLTLQRVHQT